MNIQFKQPNLRETHLEGILTVRSWLDKAILEQDKEQAAIYQRILDEAIFQFHKKFPDHK